MIWLIFAAALLAQQASAPVPVTTRVEGTVTNSLNGAPVGKAMVIFRARDQDHGLSYADETDGSGHFSIDGVEPGEYAAVAERAGFSFQPAGAAGAPPPPIKVEAGRQIKDIKIRLTPLGTIAGRVVDADGDPVAGARVAALRSVYSDGKKELRNVDQVQTGDKGDFRLFGLGAGTFYLSATFDHRVSNGPPESVSTFYPNATDQGHAAPIQLRTGAHLGGFDIRLQSTSVYSVRFELPVGYEPHGGYSPSLISEQGYMHGSVSMFSENDVVFHAVPPGSYEAIVHLDNEGQQSYAIRHVEVTNADVNGGTLTFVPAVDVTGAVRVEGGAFSGFEKLRVNLQADFRNPLMGNVNVQVKPDGSFLIKSPAPRVYEIGIARTPGVYLKSVRAGDKELAGRRVDLSTRMEPLTIVLGADVGEVEGSVQNAGGDPVARARVNVIAYGDHSNRGDLNRFGFTDDKGEFKIKDVPPGDYKVFAWEDVPVGAPQDPEFRKPFEKQAASLRMQSNGHEKVQVTAISKAQVDRSSQ
jgi:Carboxypeptidase regulatory-like domain